MTVAVASSASILDQALPRFDFHEVHSSTIAVTPEEAWEAVTAVRPLEVRLLAPLMAIRVLPALLLGRSALEYDRSATLIELFLRNGFVDLGSRPGEEFAAGAIGRFWSPAGNRPLPIGSAEEFAEFADPGYAKGAFNLTVEPADGGTLVRTETRVAGTDPDAARRFGHYWRLIHTGSALIRISWLNAIRRRAERL